MLINRLLRGMIPEPAVQPAKWLLSPLPLRWRVGRRYWHWRRQLQIAQNWTPEQIESWQLTRLRQIVSHAYEKTEGYRDLYRRAGIHPEDIRTLEDIKHLPCTTKQTFQDNLEAFSCQQIGRMYGTTGGSTGIPLGFYHTSETQAIERAFCHAAWAKLGWRFGDRTAMLRGGVVGSEQKPYSYDPFNKSLMLSSYYLTERSLPGYLEAIRRYQPRSLQTYPSSLNLLCRLLLAAGVSEPVSFKLILLGSENIYDWQLENYARVFPSVKLFGWYGHAENAIFAPWCGHSRSYHIQPMYGFTELLRDDGSEATEGEEGELIGTGFHNPVTPFIRYRTMDRAVRGGSHCRACGHRGMLLGRITGRSHELIVTKTGRVISMTAINMHDDIFDPLRQFQFFQEKIGEVMFRYVAKTPLSEQQLRRIRAGLMIKLGNDTELSLQAVDEIPRKPSGKCSFLDQRLPVERCRREAERSVA